MIDGLEEEPAAEVKRTRPRKDKFKIDREEIANRVIEFFTTDDSDREAAIYAHLQRYAKFRMWTEGKDWPWEDASDAAIPDMMTRSLKVQDTLHNAVMSSRPAVVSKAIKKVDVNKETAVNQLLDYQMFVENKGEVIVSEMVDAFVNDPCVVVFVPWVDEDREVHEIYTLPEIPITDKPEVYFATHLHTVYSGQAFRKKDKDGWSWEVQDKEEEWFPVEFYSVGEHIEMDAQRDVNVFNGPRPIVVDFEDILAPARAANLQIPSPSNPGGAAHVVKVDYPTIDEIKRLKASGFYDMVTDEEIEKLERADRDDSEAQSTKEQLDAMQGSQENEGKNQQKSPDHKTLTRLTCFDVFDIDGDGVNEDVIWWVIKEEKLLLRARELTQVYPANPPRRPFAEGSFLPVRGRRLGISLLEMIEGLHDVIKQFADQTIDGGTITNVPFFFYRSTSNMRNETMRLWPGEGYPMSDPKNDVYFPTMPQQGSTFGFNLVTLFEQWEEKLTTIGDLQLGGVPQGKSSALRTVRGMQSVMSQGDARPERILRRFFMCLSEVYAQMHELNQVFLPRDKQYRVSGVTRKDEDPFKTVKDPNEIRGRFQFDFIANAMNTSKDALQSALDELMTLLINPLTMQMGVVQPSNVYNLMRDSIRARGQDPDKYITPPNPDDQLTPLFVEDVLTLLLAGEMPDGRPAEPDPQQHLQKLVEFSQGDEFGYLTPMGVNHFKAWVMKVSQRIQQQMQQQAMMQAAGQFQTGQPGQGVPGPQGTAPVDTAQAPLQKNELMNESLPGAGGGGNQGFKQ